MASLKNAQMEAMATIDTAKAMVDKVLSIMEIMVNMPSFSIPISANPIALLMQLLEHAGAKYEDVLEFLTNFLMWVTPVLEVSVKAALLTNLKKMVSCSIDPRIPEQYRKEHQDPSDMSTPNLYGIDINIETIDMLDKLSLSPLSPYAKNTYFGLSGVNDVYKFARADDFDAFLWFVIHKGKFPNPASVTLNGSSFTDNIHGCEYTVDAASQGENPTLLKELKLSPQDNMKSSILPGNTFRYVTEGTNPSVLSMCIDCARDEENKIVSNTLVPTSDDLTSVNWYIRTADQLGANLGWAWKYETDDDGNTKRKKSREYSKERAICNLQYIDQASTGDSPITGLVNNKIRFTILPAPYMHVPDISAGEPVWRFKKLLFDADGNYDPNGKYTLPKDATETRKTASATGIDGETIERVYFEYAVNGTAVCNIDGKSGEVTVLKSTDNINLTIPYLRECYKGLTVYEFNYDYVMGMRLFDAKVLAATLLETLINTRLGISLDFEAKHQEATDRIKSIIKEIVTSDDSEINDCFFSFDNSKYDDLLKRAAEKKAKQQRFGNVTRNAGVFDSVNEILAEYDTATELHQQKEILSRAINQAAVTISQGSEDEDQYNVQFSFVFDLIENLIIAIMNAVLSPKVLMLLEVNQKLMGGSWQMFSVEDLIKAMRSIITDIIKEVRDLLIQELLKFLMKLLQPIMELLGSIIIRERLEDFAEIIKDILTNCPVLWFRLSSQYQDTKLDTIDYADIDTTVNNGDAQPTNKNC